MNNEKKITGQQNPSNPTPLEEVLATLTQQLDRFPPSAFPPEMAATLTELQRHLRRADAPVQAGSTGQPTDYETQYEALLNLMVNGYFATSLNLRIQQTNPASERFLGLSKAEIIGRNFEEFFATEEREQLREKARQLFETTGENPVIEWESALERATGALPVVVKATPLLNRQGETTGFRWLLQDISRRKQTNARLQRTYKLLLALVEASPLGIIMVDAQGRVQLWSEAAEQILGWMQEEALGQMPKHLATATLRKNWERAAQEEIASRHEEVETVCYRKDGKRILIRNVTAALRNPDGEIAGWLEIFTDISNQHKMRVELHQMKSRLAASREEEQRRLARSLHDDVIQQLIALQMELANNRRLTERGVMQQSGAELAKTFAHIESEVVATVRELRGVLRELRPAGLEEYGLVTALDGYISQLKRQYPERQIQFRKHWSPEPLDVSMPVATCLFRVAQEALRNIMRHTTAQGVDITLNQDDTHTVLRIQDDGVGFDAQPRFAQLAQEGHFGLVGMLERVELVGGQLEVLSAPGTGAAILVRIPRIAEE